jgi:Ca-activated chloride channel family protein
MNYTFAYPWVLALLVLVPMLAALFFIPRIKRAQTGTFTFSRVSALKEQSRGWRRFFEPLPDVLVLVAIALMIVALARPQAVEAEEVEVEGVDIYLALDMSGSMQAIDKSKQELSQMVSRNEEPDNRFVSAVDVLQEFVRSREYDRIGMVVFAKDAFLQFPLTLDYNTIEGMLDRLKLGDIDAGGTAIGNAIGRAVAGLKDSETETKILILITDGDRRGGNISPMQAAQIAKDLDVKVFPILVGKDGPSLVPMRMRSLFGVETRYQEQKFPIDPELLENIAQKTGGEFYRASDAQGLKERLHTILDRFERTRIKDASNVDKQEMYRPMVIWAILLIALQMMLRHTVLRKFP